MNYAKTIERFGQSPQVNLLPLDGEHERLSEGDAGHLSQRGLNHRQRPRFLSGAAARRAVMSPANWSRHNQFQGISKAGALYCSLGLSATRWMFYGVRASYRERLCTERLGHSNFF